MTRRIGRRQSADEFPAARRFLPTDKLDVVASRVQQTGPRRSPNLESKPMKVVFDRHLGGYVEGGDPATHYPEMWRWIVESFTVQSVIDIGCADGQALDFFAGLGCRVLGVEGVPQAKPAIARHDYTLGPYRPADSFDLGWCCEFVEHVRAEFVPNFLATFGAVRSLLLLTHAFTGQDGYHHVNCQPSDYWIERVEGVGFRFDPALTAECRTRAAANPNPYNHFVRSGLVFRRSGDG